MATFGYEALDANGKVVKGTIDSETVEKAKGELKGRGVTIITIGEQSLLNKDLNFDIGGYPTPRDLSVFCRQFVSMVRAGVTILDSLKMLAESTENQKLQDAIKAVRVSTEKGETLADAMMDHPKIFPSLMINMVAAGESSGSLDKSLERMSVQLEQAAKTRAMVKKAMIYPVVVTIVALVVTVVMLVKIIPTYTTMFQDLGTELPGITKAVQAASDFLIEKWFVIVPVIGALVGAFVMFKQTDTGIHFFGKLAITIPAVKNLTVKSAAAMMARTLSTLLGSGVPLVESVGIVSTTMTNIYFKEALENAKSEVVIGQPLSVPLQACGLFPPMVYHMVRIGEESGNTEDMLDKLADYYEEEVEMAVQSLMAAMEPVIIIILAGVVGILVGACMAPMLTMYSALNEM